MTKGGGNLGDDSQEHPAQGCVELSRVHCSSPGVTLFGSNMRHQIAMMLTVSTAEGARGLHAEHHYPRKMICEFMFSEAQWASFISSQGEGGGVPCTFRYKPVEGYTLEDVPEMEVEPMTEKFAREIEEETRERTQELVELVTKIEDTLKSNSRAGLMEMVRDLRIRMGNLPSNMGFIQTQLGEAMHDTVQAGKAELEAFQRAVVTRAGLRALAEDFQGDVVKLVEDDQ